MKRFIPYTAFACLTFFTATSGLPVLSGGCSSYMNKKEEIKCVEDDTECQTEKAENFKLNESVSL